MRLALYSEINITCILIVLLILYKVVRGADQQNNQRLFVRTLLVNALLFVSDLLWILLEERILLAPVFVNYLLNAFYYILLVAASYYWFLYSEGMQDSRLVSTKRRRRLCAIPLLVLIVLVGLSYRTKWLFYIDAHNVYHRGSLYLLQMAIAYSYMLVTAVKAVVQAKRSTSYAVRQKLLTLSSFIILPVVSGVLQAALPGVPLVCVGITLSLLNVYINLLEQRISIDPLTQLNNRSQLYRHLSGKIARRSEGKELYLLMMDVDAFKRINDKYGHVEGDAALVRVAEALKKAFSNSHAFISRYGGDEFIAVYEAEREEEIAALCDGVTRAIARASAAAGAPYALTMSMGYVKWTPDMRSAQELVKRADAELYKEKQTKQR